MARISTEVCYKIWNDETGDRFEVCDDADALGMTEIRYVDSDGKICSRLSITDSFLPAVFAALEKKMIEKKLSLAS
jgi:hypothetical protein